MSTVVAKTDPETAEKAAMATVLSFTKTLGRKRKAASEMLDEIMDKAGGRDATIQAIAGVNKKAMDGALKEDATIKEVELGLKAADGLLRANMDVDKRTPPIDLSSLTEDELRDILMEPARQLILTDEKFLRQLLSMPEIRKRLTSIIEAEAANVSA